MNHAHPGLLAQMARQDPDAGLIRDLVPSLRWVQCSGCRLGHLSPATHKTIKPIYLPGNTLDTDIAGPLPCTPAWFQYFLTIT